MLYKSSILSIQLKKLALVTLAIFCYKYKKAFWPRWVICAVSNEKKKKKKNRKVKNTCLKPSCVHIISTSFALDSRFSLYIKLGPLVKFICFTLSLTSCNTVQKINFPIKDFFSKCDQIRFFLRIWSHLLNKTLIENFIFCTV